MRSSDVHDGESWRAFLGQPGAKCAIADVRWLLAGCPGCDCRYWTVTGDGYAYCDGCTRGFVFALYACPVSGHDVWRYDPDGRLTPFLEVRPIEDELLGSVGFSASDFAPARLLEVSGRPGAVRVIVCEAPGRDGVARTPEGISSTSSRACRRVSHPSAGRHGVRYDIFFPQ